MPDVFRSPLPYFGNTALWSSILVHGAVDWLAGENYQRRSQRNRTVIANAQGRQTLSIPLLGGKHQQCPIEEVEISYGEDWRRQHWLSLQAAYGSAPYWTEYADELAAQFERRPQRLWAWNTACTELVLQWLRAPVVTNEVHDWDKRTDAKRGPSHSDAPPASYPQVFTERTGWQPDLSILDLILCHGPAAAGYLAPNP